jgi:predicted transcriptional regulator
MRGNPPSLGELGRAILEVLWASDRPLAVREVQSRLRRRPPLAYTTVLTVLDRLFDKGLVARAKDGKAFLYTPKVSRQSWFGEQAARVLTAGTGSDEGVLLAFLDGAERADPRLLDRLSHLIAARRREGSR